MNTTQYSKNPAVFFETCRDLNSDNGCLSVDHLHIHYCLKTTQTEEQTIKKGLITKRYVQTTKATRFIVIEIQNKEGKMEVKNGSVDISNGIKIDYRAIATPHQESLFFREVITHVVNRLNEIPGITFSKKVLKKAIVDTDRARLATNHSGARRSRLSASLPLWLKR